MGEMNDPLQVLRRHHRPRRIRRRIQNDRLGPRRNRLLNRVRRDAEVLRLAGFEENHLAARVLDDVLEAHPVRNRQNYLVAVIHQNLDRVEEREFPTGRKDGLVDPVVRPEIAGMPLHDRLPHVRNARNDGIAREIGLDRRNCSVFNVPRSSKMRLSGAKIHKVRALCAQLGSLGGHRHGCGNLNTAYTVSKNFRRSGNCHDASIFTDFVFCIQYPLKHWPFEWCPGFIWTPADNA